ncbi:MAG: glycosyltransferase family 39 protein [Acidobacteriaceae bacterium]
MQLVRRFRLPAVFCALAVLVCELIARPYANMGICDDGPYIIMVQHLAATGHIAYNGWAAPMLGWQLYLGAAFIKLFGFSFTSIRMSNVLVAMALAFVLQRTLVRAGINERNATFGTLALVLSPLYLMLSATFMTDITGLFAVVICLYGCLRALQTSASPSSSDRSVIAWLCFAVATNALCGTSRQIAWLGLLVMVPSTLWLLRARRRVLFAGAAATLAGALFIFACMQWLKHQSYLIPEHLFVHSLPVAHTLAAIAYLFADIPFLLLPLAAIFLLEIRRSRPRVLALIAAVSIAYLLLALHWRHLHPNLLLEPTMRDWVNIYGTFEGSDLPGRPLIFISQATQIVITIVCFGGVMGLLASLFAPHQQERQTVASKLTSDAASVAPSTPISWKQLGVLLLPFTAAYTLLLFPRAADVVIYDRYALALLVIAVLCLVRYYQQRIEPRLPLSLVAFIALVAVCGVAMTHNTFALYRARAALAAELRANGVPDTSVDNGWEYNNSVEIHQAGHINDPSIVTPAHAYVPVAPPSTDTCFLHGYFAFPHIHPIYGISFTPNACHGPAPFAPVHYSRWPYPTPGTLYVIRYIRPAKP